MSTNVNETPKSYTLSFHGKGSEYFAIMIVNWLFSIITFGLYYPWARAKQLQYIYGNTALDDERFHFAGTGREMFRGFIMVILFYLGILVGYSLITFALRSPGLAILFLYLAILAIIPFALHGSLKYRLSRTSYRGIRFGYRGDRMELTTIFIKGLLLTVVTLGIYGAWFFMSIRRYTHEHMRFGEVEFRNDASGLDWFLLNLKGYIFSILTLGIYIFWWQRNIFSFYYDNLKASKGDESIEFRSTATAGGFFELIVVNFIIILFTFGLGFPWVVVRTQKFVCDSIQIEGNLNLDTIIQTEEQYKDATGEGAVDFFDIDLA